MPALLHRPETWLFTVVLAVFYPIADAFFFVRLKTAMQLYIWNILAAWTLTIAAAYIIFHSGLTLSAFGQNLGTCPRTLIVSAILLVLVAAIVLINKLQKKKSNPEKIAKALENVRKILPVTPNERLAWIPVALTAGFCEEFLYRGWLLNITGSALKSVWLGLLVSSILFGFAHLYQGRRGMLGTGILGLVFGLIYIASHSLLPGQVLHTLIDLNNGLTLGRVASRLQPPPQSPS
jgi:membrane protease YdiL (CAAX protease family)